MAEQSSQSTVEIANSIQQIEEIAIKASDEFEKMYSHFTLHMDQASNSRESFDLLINQIDSVTSVLANIEATLFGVNELNATPRSINPKFSFDFTTNLCKRRTNDDFI